MKKKWWNEKIAYQIYPKSFYDTNGDGIGDVKGITKKLDYLKSLGVGILWISPIYKSPMKDNGYDISDYYQIDPVFGTMEEMEELIAEAKKRDIRILMDLVVNHCSMEHEWFKRAMKDPTGRYGDYFIIKKGEGGKEPNNWRSIFGGSVWSPVEGSPYYYYHTFAKEQPDLNWENEELRQEIYDMMNFWLEKGLGGFRVDAITYIKKKPSFESLEPDGADGLAGLGTVSENYPGIELFLKEMRVKTFDVHDAFSVAEMSGVNAENLKDYIGSDGLFGSIFDFSYLDLDVINGEWYKPVKVTAEKIKEKMYASQDMAEKSESLLAVVLENHDQPRSLNKLIPQEDIGYESATMLGTVNLMLRGVPFIYQGEEIGMTNSSFSNINEYDDIMLFGQYQRALLEGCTEEECLMMANRRSRDHSRTPMQWSAKKQAEFTEGIPWFPVNRNYKTINVETEEKGKSVLNYYRELTKLRTGIEWKELFTYGGFRPVMQEYPDIIAYERVLEGLKVLVIANFVSEKQQIQFPESTGQILLSNYKVEQVSGVLYTLRPYEAMVITIN